MREKFFEHSSGGIQSTWTQFKYVSTVRTLWFININMCMHAMSLQWCLFATLQIVAHQAPLSMGSPGKKARMSCHVPLQGIT